MRLSLINHVVDDIGLTMKNLSYALLTACLTAISLAAISSTASQPASIKPALISQQELAGEMIKHPRVSHETQDDGSKAMDVFSMLSSDKKFIVGRFQSEPNREVITEPYGVDEYMYFLKGGVTLTSSDGTVTEVKAGDAVTIPKEWTGIWETQGYTKIYVIYSADNAM